jgi:hypothetical protein
VSAINRVALLLFISLIVAALFWLRAINSTEFANLPALNAQMKTEGFVPIGRFGKGWPATIVEIREQDDLIKFKRSDGQQQTYQGFDGYRLKVVRLNNRNGKEIIVVYRSEPVDAPLESEQHDRPLIKQI